VAGSLYSAIPLMAALAIIQTAVLPRFAIAGVEPQLVFVVALAWGLLRGLEEGLVWAFIAGIWVDLLSVTPVGLSALAFMGGVAVPVLLQQVMPPRRLLVAVIMAVLGTSIYLAFYALSLRIFGHPVSLRTLLELLPLIAFHAVLIVPVYLLLASIVRVLKPRRVEF